MKQVSLSLFILFFTLIYTTQSHACSRGIVTIENFAPAHVDFTASSTQTVNFTITHTAPTTNCIVLVVAEYGNAGSWPGRFMQITAADTIPFNIHKLLPSSAANIIRDQVDLTSTAQLIFPPVFATAGGATTNSISYIAELGTVPPAATPGLYREGLVLKVLATPLPITLPVSSWPIVHERAIAFNYYLAPIIDIAIVNTGDAFNSLASSYFMNFGELQSSESQAADIMIQTNVGYRLSVSSLNDGELVNQTAASNTIPYSFTADGLPVVLAGTSGAPLEISSNIGPHPGGGYRIPITATISVLNNPLQGAYQDTISLTVTAF